MTVMHAHGVQVAMAECTTSKNLSGYAEGLAEEHRRRYKESYS